MSAELDRARQWYRDLVVALTPADAPPTPAGMRQAYDRACEEMPIPDGVAIEPADAGGVSGMWLTAPGASTERTILYLHPGGYAVGSVQGHRHVAAAYSRAAGARVLAIDYRLAPEHPHPGAVHDAVAAFDALVEAGAAPESIAIVGESAGGGLALATLIALRDGSAGARGGRLPACAVAVSPWTDLALTGASMDSKADEDVVNSREMLGGLAMMYLMGATAPEAPLASPLYADLAGLPPMLVMAGSAEVLLDDATRFVSRARAAGADATLEVAEGMPHIWTFFESFLPEASAAIQRAGEFVARHCGEPALR